MHGEGQASTQPGQPQSPAGKISRKVDRTCIELSMHVDPKARTGCRKTAGESLPPEAMRYQPPTPPDKDSRACECGPPIQVGERVSQFHPRPYDRPHTPRPPALHRVVAPTR